MSEHRPIRFGVNYLPGPALETRRWVQVAEETGFDFVGIADSQSVYRDAYLCLALAPTGTPPAHLVLRVIHTPTRVPSAASFAMCVRSPITKATLPEPWSVPEPFSCTRRPNSVKRSITTSSLALCSFKSW